jgi:hypothetical protein
MKKLIHRQRRYGAALVLLGVLSAVIGGGEITAALVLVPLGIWMLCTKEAILYEEKGTR